MLHAGTSTITEAGQSGSRVIQHNKNHISELAAGKPLSTAAVNFTVMDKLLVLLLNILPMFCMAQVLDYNAVDSVTPETVQLLFRGVETETKTDTVLVDCLCVDRQLGLIVEKKKRQRVLKRKRMSLPSKGLEYRYTYRFIPVETTWLENVEDCYILTKAAAGG